ncbi:IscS subfamily cysteine desulfurase [Salipaludibacillus sp. LMS25]|jgi:cysteine desulfurase|uniref:IscS subfamily cysteine desulfurase n=1 Tax=Salipaludibacillus sp. LMS25 TaxID=2924031 RepID=UPI0020D09E70|nr:IscS subfamily cysteine desulfurase [Salipaludibacillus sp. LMS25]UTR14193.1 IscS subfamily cysteine desulfurase [Salipaludibacillus sp. LMS25]
MIYLDHAATTPMSDQAKKIWLEANDIFYANTSSLHEAGNHAAKLLMTCQHQLASLVGTNENGIFFTSGGSEANILALESLFSANRKHGNHVITSDIEHPSVLSFFKRLEVSGVEVSYIKAKKNGQVCVKTVMEAVRSDTCLVSIQHVNSETGIIQPVAEIGEYLKERSAVLHCDCVQSFGKIPVTLGNLHVDAISISSHKIYGPKGVGAVCLAPHTPWNSIHPLTTHQRGFRPGTLDMPSIAAFINSALDLHSYLEENLTDSWEKREHFLHALSPLKYRLSVICAPEKHQLPTIVGLAIEGVQGQYMLASLDRYHICISTGSACQSTKATPPAIMHSFFKTEVEQLRFFRVSFGISTTLEELEFTAKKIIQIAEN